MEHAFLTSLASPSLQLLILGFYIGSQLQLLACFYKVGVWFLTLQLTYTVKCLTELMDSTTMDFVAIYS